MDRLSRHLSPVGAPDRQGVRTAAILAVLVLGWRVAPAAITVAPLPHRPPVAVAPALRTPADTIVPPLSPAELRELRRLERIDARERRRRGQAPAPEAYDPQRARGANPFALAALPTGFVGVINFFLGLSVANPGVFFALSVLSFAAAVVFGAVGVKRARRWRLRRRGLGIAGMVLGILGGALYALIAAGLLSGA